MVGVRAEVLDEDDKEMVGEWVQEQSAGFDPHGVSQTMRNFIS